MIDILRAEFVDEARWRDVLYVAVTFPLSIIEFVVVGLAWAAALFALTMPVWFDPPAPLPPAWLGSVAGVALLFVAGSLSQLVMALHRQVVVGLLCTQREPRAPPCRSRRCARVDRTCWRRGDRAAAGSSATCTTAPSSGWSGCRSISASRASGSTPIRPPRSSSSARARSRHAQALAEIRQLVRGIAPSILLDRGLVAALESITGGGSGADGGRSATSRQASGCRPRSSERPTSSSSEALANVAKHSGATRSEVRCRREGGRAGRRGLGRRRQGGADIAPGGGLAGLASRVAGVDGAFTVSSPVGGPTLVRADFPVAADVPVSGWRV